MKPTYAAHTPHASTKAARPRMMLVGIWLGRYWVFFSFFDHYKKFSSVLRCTVLFGVFFFGVFFFGVFFFGVFFFL